MTDSGTAKAKIDSLRAEINRHNHLYYVLDSPEISDADYDGLMRQLRRLEEKYPQLVTPDSPTQRVGAAPLEALGIVEHRLPLLSLGNAFSQDELVAWYTRISKLTDGEEPSFVCEHKIDGLAVALTYIDGRFTIGATRGDGFHGENITQNLKTIGSVPLSVSKEAPQRFEVRGEVFMPVAGFKKLNKERAEEGLSLFANPRNAAAGSVRQLDSRITAARPLDIYIYMLGYADGGAVPLSHWEILEYLKSLGFKVNPNNRLLNDIGQVGEYYDNWLEKRESLPYEADGIVVKVNQRELQEKMGEIGHEPRWAVAYKFPAVQGNTVLKDIKISVGRTGTMNPYAVLEPVSIGGVTIKQATLHNEDDIHRKDIRKGDTVIIQRAGDVIPQVIGPVLGKRPEGAKEFNLYEELDGKCPVCHFEIFKPEGEVMYYCPNAACPAQRQQRIELFASRGAMDIRGIGEKMSVILTEEGLVDNYADLYSLERDKLLRLDRMAEKSVDNLLENIRKSKGRPLARIICGLGIRHVGEEVAGILAQKFGSLDALDEAMKGVSKVKIARERLKAKATREKLRALAAREKLKAKIARERLKAKATREELKALDAREKLKAKVINDELKVLATREKNMSIDTIGPKIVDSIIAFFNNDENKRIIKELKRYNVLPEVKEEERGELPLEGREFVITGRLEGLSRQEAEAKIRALGGSAKSDVTRKTDYLVVGAEPGSKLARASSMGIEQISESELMKIIKEYGD